MRIPEGEGPLPATIVQDWNRFLHTQSPSAPVQGARVVPEHLRVFDDGVLFPLQRRREAAAMMELALGIHPRVIVDIGSDKGGGVYNWCLLPTVRKIIACEIRGTPYIDQLCKAFPHTAFLGLDCGSRDCGVIEAAQAFLGGEPIDVLFLDGEKAHAGDDYTTWEPLVRNGGLVMFHDVNEVPLIEPGRVWRRIESEGRVCSLIEDTSEGMQALERQANGLQPRTGHEGWLYAWGVTSASVGVVEVRR